MVMYVYIMHRYMCSSILYYTVHKSFAPIPAANLLLLCNCYNGDDMAGIMIIVYAVLLYVREKKNNTVHVEK